MNLDAPDQWRQANQHALAAALARVRAALERHAARGQGDVAPEPAAPPEPAEDASAYRSALDQLCSAFRLSPFERDVLLLSAGVELDSRFGPLCAAAQGDARRTYPTFSLALAALPDAHWSALVPTAPLRRWRLLDFAAGDSLTLAPLRIDERILHYLAGLSYLDERLQGLIDPVPDEDDLPLPPSHAAVVQRLVAACRGAAGDASYPVVQLGGEDVSAKRGVAAAVCRALGVPLYEMQAADVPGAVAEREALAGCWEREAALDGGALLVEGLDESAADAGRAGRAFVARLRGLTILTVREPVRPGKRAVVYQEVAKPSAAEQQVLWRGVLGPAAVALNGQLDLMVSHFNLGTREIQAAHAGSVAPDEAPENLPGRLWAACRVQARRRLDGLAQRIESAATWDDLVLPAPQRQTLREIASHLRQRSTVYARWGFAAKGARGLGINALFSGASGTGKTMAAEVLAGELKLDLYRIDLSSVVSKYIGETEKNLRRVFDAAEESGAVLLFDEADALFGKRSEVKDSHDRYANVEVSYLLQRMEAYGGVAILTTNLKKALDDAFLRRIRFVVPFPFPDAAQRAEIWRRSFPARTPTEGLDPGKLARLNVAGGNIRNIALNAAFLAAEAAEPVRMKHLLAAARSEYTKLEKPLTEAETGNWR